MDQSQYYILPIERAMTCQMPQGHMLWDINSWRYDGHIPFNYICSSYTHVTFFKGRVFSLFLFGCLGTRLCCDNQGWLSWISYTVELNFPFELLTILNVLESVISFAEEIFLFGNVGSFSTLLFWQRCAGLIRTQVIGSLGRQRDVKPVLC